MTDKERWIETWAPSLGGVEQAEQEWVIKQEREAHPIRSAAVYVMAGYQSPASSKWIETASQRRDDMKRTGSRPWEGMAAEKQESERAKKYDEHKQDAALDHTVRSAWRDLPDSKKQLITQGA